MIEAIVQVIFSAFVEFIILNLGTFFYYSGWVILKVITIGYYPPKEHLMAFGAKPHSKVFVGSVGFIAWCAAAYLLLMYYLK